MSHTADPWRKSTRNVTVTCSNVTLYRRCGTGYKEEKEVLGLALVVCYCGLGRVMANNIDISGFCDILRSSIPRFKMQEMDLLHADFILCFRFHHTTNQGMINIESLNINL